jgi:hypothetical protein
LPFSLRKKFDGSWGVEYHGPEAADFESACRQWFDEQKASGNDLMQFLQGRSDDWVFFECWNARQPEALSGLVEFLREQFELED